MRVVFAVAALEERYEHVRDRDSGWWQPLGLLSVASYLQEEIPEAEVEIWDEQMMKHGEMVKRIIDAPPDFLGLSPSIANYLNSLELAQLAKSKGSRVIFGGHYATSLGRVMLKNNFCLDAVVIHDGEKAMVELVRGRAYSEIPNLLWRNERGEIIVNQIVWMNLNSLPFLDYSLLDLELYFQKHDRHQKKYRVPTQYKRPLTLASQRGCLWRERSRRGCIFCARMEPFWRACRPKKVWQEITGLVERFKIDSGIFVSDDFIGNHQWFDLFYKTRPRDLSFGIRFLFARPAGITPDLVKKLKVFNPSMVFLGIESGDPQCLKYCGKGTSLTSHLRAVALLSEHEIKCETAFILGMPGEDRKSMRNSIRHAEKLAKMGVFHFYLNVLVPFPGSQAWQKCLMEIPGFAQKYGSSDILDPFLLQKEWIKYFCQASFEEIEEGIKEIEAFNPQDRENEYDD